MTRALTRALLIVAIGLAFVPVDVAGQVAGVTQPGPQDEPIFRSRADFVSVDVAVWRGGSPVRGLGPEDFIVHDGGVPQRLQSVSMEEVPIDVTMFVDTSGSLSDLREGLARDVERIFRLLRPMDRLRVLTLGYQVHDVFGWRSAGQAAAFDLPPVGRISAVYDALWLALLRKPEPGRRHLIIALTDGDDWSSVTTSQTLLEATARSESVLHIVRLPSVSSDRGRPWQWSAVRPDAEGQQRLRDAAAQTGGRLHQAASAGQPVVDAFARAFDDFRRSYVLRYSYSGPAFAGWHEIDVRINRPDRYTVRARRGYVAP